MLVEESLEQILERWKHAFDQYDALKTTLEPLVVRWEWTEGERYSLLPFYFKRYPGRARILKKTPISGGSYFRYGFDIQDRVRVLKIYSFLDLQDSGQLQIGQEPKLESGVYSETFFSYMDAFAEIIEYSQPPRIPLKVQQIFYESGKVVQHLGFRLNGYTPLYSEKGKDPQALYEWLGPNGRFRQVESYQYDKELLTSIHLYSEQPGVAPFKTIETLSYDKIGNLLLIERKHEAGSYMRVYRKREKGQTFQSIREAAVQKLTRAIINRLREEGIQETLCCLELAYQSVSHYFPPVLIPSPESERQRLLASKDPEAKYWVFAPTQMRPSTFLEITDPETLEACSLLDQEIRAGNKWNAAREILCQVAAVLTRHDWRGILSVTQDFVVFAIDWEMEGDQLESVLGASVSQEQIQIWKEKGWL